jgi:hypothetical protein
MEGLLLLLLLLPLTSPTHGFHSPIPTTQSPIHRYWQSRSFDRVPTTARFSATTATETLPEGLLKTVVQPGQGQRVNLGDIATIKYSCYIIPEDDSTTVPFARALSQKVVVGDGSMIVGWEKALRSMRVGERSIVRITDPQLGYGAQGVVPVVPPNAVLELDLNVLDAQPATTNIDFDTLAMADTTPRTASEISAAFEARQAARGEVVELEGLEYWIAKARNFYFFGLFEGETGERAPWFLRPSITFPLAFLIVGAAFYVSFIGGAISERGAQIKDELDEIILSSNVLWNTPTTSWTVAVNDILGTVPTDTLM